MKRWLNTALALVLMLAIAAGGFFLPNFVSARLDRRNQDTEFALSTGDEQSPATVLRLKLTDGIMNLGASEEPPIALDESAAAHTRDEMTRYAQTFLTALYKDCELFGADFTDDGVSVDYASYGSGFVLWSITLSDPRGDSVTLLLDDTTGCPLAIGYSFADSYAFQLEQNGLWSYLLRVFENRIAVTISAALGATYDEVQAVRGQQNRRPAAAAQRRERGLQRQRQCDRLPAVLRSRRRHGLFPAGAALREYAAVQHRMVWRLMMPF